MLRGRRDLQQPLQREAFEVDVADPVGIELQGCRHGREVSEESLVETSDTIAASKRATPDARQPVAAFAERAHRVSAVCMDIHAREVGNEPWVPEWVDVEVRARFNF